MTLAATVAAVMFIAVTIYSVLGGADFGSGFWDITAGNYKKGAPLRRLIDHSIGPVWEANHVWLIFILVVLWSAFPTAFAAIMRTLAIPFWLVGLGVVLRGAGFAFRKFAPTLRWAQVTGFAFAASSFITPFFMGTIAGSVASGRVPLEGTGDIWGSWINLSSFIGGVIAVCTCTFLAGVFLTAEARVLGLEYLADQLRLKSFFVGLFSGLVVLLAVFPLAKDAPTLFTGLIGNALPLMIISAIAGVTTLNYLWHNRYRRARISAAIAVAAITLGWGVAQYPWILVDEAKIVDVAGAETTLWGLTIATVLAALLVLPPLVYLYVLAERNALGSETTAAH